MNEIQRVNIVRLTTGVPGLDTVLGGGLPEYSFTMIAGDPGTGKTTLAHQILFNLATPEGPALYFSVMGESILKMLRYQQQMAYFDPAKVGNTIQFVSLSDALLNQDLEQVLTDIVQRVEASSPSLVVFDSFHNIYHVAARRENGGLDIQGFLQRLAIHLTSWQATTFLLGTYRQEELNSNAVFTQADAILWLSQIADHNSVVRKMQVIKVRGQEFMPGLHTVHLDQAGVQVFPRINVDWEKSSRVLGQGRASTGVLGLDDLVGGGIPKGDAVLLSGSTGTGKSVLATQFIAEGVRCGEPGVIVVFEEHPQEYIRRAESLGMDLKDMESRGDISVIYLRPLDLSPDETFAAIRKEVARVGAQRVVIDSISGFELALAPNFREDFRESLYRLVGTLTGIGVTVLMTMEIEQSIDELRFSPYLISFLSEDLILLRHVQIGGQLRKSLAVVKMRNSNHNKDLWLYDITEQGIVIRQRLENPGGTGAATATLTQAPGQFTYYPGLTQGETTVLVSLLELGEATTEALAGRTGMEEGELTAALNRLLALHHAVQQEGGIVYRPTANTQP